MDNLLSSTGLPQVSLGTTYGFPVHAQLNNSARAKPTSSSPTNEHNHNHVGKGTRKRKISSFTDPALSPESEEDDEQGGEHRNGGGSARKHRPTGTKRACNQCRQQKLKCNVVESPWKSCDRCIKHTLRCEITADFKRVGKRSQQAELERSNELLQQKNDGLELELARTQQQLADLRQDQHHLRRQLTEQNQMAEFTSTPPQHDDGSHDAALLLNLKQSASDTLASRITPMGRSRQLGNVTVFGDVIDKLWIEFFSRYHNFLPVLDLNDTPDIVIGRSNILFWTVMMTAARHFDEDPNLLASLTPAYKEHLKNTISRPPTRDQHHVVKALCILCTWPLPVSSSTDDMTFTHSGIMMKFAMHLGIHRPSNPSDFTNIPMNLRADEITDRLKTWALCNLVAQNVSTGYGQPPETVYDATLQIRMDESSEVLEYLHSRLEIEKFTDRVTREIYCPQADDNSQFHDTSMSAKAALLNTMLKQLQDGTNLSNPLDAVYFCAARMHLKLQVFFDNHNSPRYSYALDELYNAVKDFLTTAFNCDVEPKYHPNYILQMLTAACVALLKLLNSFFGFAEYIDREDGEGLFWKTIQTIRSMSVAPNDLPVRLGEVFAQMWNAWDTARMEGSQLAESIANGEVDASLTLKRRYRMSMSHVFDSIWRWKEEMHGEASKLKDAVKNPTSPVAMTHRSSFSNGRRPSSSLMEDANNTDVQGMGNFGGFGGVALANPPDMADNSFYHTFDPMAWYLNDLGTTWEQPTMGW
ncbi:hypothetical protein EJ08DRAFT_599795 [Tothia fuscella]|uniref:Zn(2)-C6 fungal-type domain-containing protein n=1 Tax=Tothia fuscella TaxID=1048955 RepID=A0A9P4TRT1_9PEZI|nr:hypothetical protein EJ08DRAFT_599795 [Tothia fuscella]